MSQEPRSNTQGSVGLGATLISLVALQCGVLTIRRHVPFFLGVLLLGVHQPQMVLLPNLHSVVSQALVASCAAPSATRRGQACVSPGLGDHAARTVSLQLASLLHRLHMFLRVTDPLEGKCVVFNPPKK